MDGESETDFKAVPKKQGGGLDNLRANHLILSLFNKLQNQAVQSHFSPSVLSAVRPMPSLPSRRTNPNTLSCVDDYLFQLWELNSTLSFRVGIFDGDQQKSDRNSSAQTGVHTRQTLPKMQSALDSRSYQSEYLKAGSVRELVEFCASNGRGLNFLLASETEGSWLRALVEFHAKRFTRRDSRHWLGVPVLLSSRSTCESPLPSVELECFEKHHELVRLLSPPDTQTTLELIRCSYGEYGRYSLIQMPKPERRELTPVLARELAERGITCVAGNCAAPYQLVVCGSWSLKVADRIRERLLEQCNQVSIIYILDPWLLHSESIKEQCVKIPAAFSDLFPRDSSYRLLLTDDQIALRPWLKRVFQFPESRFATLDVGAIGSLSNKASNRASSKFQREIVEPDFLFLAELGLIKILSLAKEPGLI